MASEDELGGLPIYRTYSGNISDASTYSDPGSFSDDHFGLFVFTVAGCVALGIVLLLTIREYYLNKYNFDICPFGTSTPLSLSRHNHVSSQQLASDREIAEALQRQLNEEEREAERLKKRAERKEWYQIYLKPFTMTAEAKDFFYAHEMDGSDATNNVTDEQKEKIEKMRAMSSGEMTEEGFASGDDDDILDLELGDGSNCCDEDEEPILCAKDAEDAHLYLKLPVFTCSNTQRSVDAHCAICVSEYEVEDRVVWSNLECKHAFHDECIMPWLAKGKKRCPICRHWFVPGARIEDQKKAFEARLEQEDSSAETDVMSSSASSMSGSSEQQRRIIVSSASTDVDTETDCAFAPTASEDNIYEATAPEQQQSEIGDEEDPEMGMEDKAGSDDKFSGLKSELEDFPSDGVDRQLASERVIVTKQSEGDVVDSRSVNVTNEV